MPPGSFHLVATVDRSVTKSTPAVMQGFFFDSRYGMHRMLGALVQCAIWHKQWTNVLYNDRLKMLVFLLDWHSRAPKFSGENLFSLLFAAHYHSWLLPITPNTAEEMQMYHPLARTCAGGTFAPNKFLMNTARSLFNRLDDNEKALYSGFETKFRTYLITEYDMYCKALKS